MDSPVIRRARLEELEALLALQQESLRRFGAPDYAADVLEAALAHMGTMDPRMIADGTYLVAEHNGRLSGCAGWTTRPLPYAKLLLGEMPPLPGRPGCVRSLYVAPGAARNGVGAALLAAVEQHLAGAGMDVAEVLVAVSGEAFFRAHGYATLSSHAFLLAPGMEFPMRRMSRALVPLTPHPAALSAPGPAAAARA